MVGVVVAGAVETVEGSEGDMLGAIALHQLLLHFRTNPSFLRLVGSEHIWYPEKRISSLLSKSGSVSQITAPLLKC